jgi:hypothetical protein
VGSSVHGHEVTVAFIIPVCIIEVSHTLCAYSWISSGIISFKTVEYCSLRNARKYELWEINKVMMSAFDIWYRNLEQNEAIET